MARGCPASQGPAALLGLAAGGGGLQGPQAWPSVPLVTLLLRPPPAHGLWCQDCTLTTNSSHCTPKQCQPSDTVCASVRITDPSSSKLDPGARWGELGGHRSPSGLLCDSKQAPVLPWSLRGPCHVLGDVPRTQLGTRPQASSSSTGRKDHSVNRMCASSCDFVKRHFFSDYLMGFINSGILKVDVDCCDQDLCNGVSVARGSPWALAGGLLLSLGPALLRAGP